MVIEAARPEVLALYAQRDKLNLFEVACWAHGAEPERVSHSAYDTLKAIWRGYGITKYPMPLNVAEEIDARPTKVLGQQIGGTLHALRIAAGGTFQRAISIARARRLLSVLGLDLPSAFGHELREAPPKPVPRQRAQEAAVLFKLAEFDIDPLALPAAPPGKASQAKEAVRTALGYSPEVMRKVWKRLRADGRLKDA